MKIYLRFTRNEEKEKCCEPLSPQLDPLETVYSPLLYQICFKASHLGDNQRESCVRLFVPWDLRSVCAFYVFGRRRSHKKILVWFSLDCPLVEAWDEQRRRPKALCECAKYRECRLCEFRIMRKERCKVRNLNQERITFFKIGIHSILWSLFIRQKPCLGPYSGNSIPSFAMPKMGLRGF